jgi:hypothetical protein
MKLGCDSLGPYTISYRRLLKSKLKKLSPLPMNFSTEKKNGCPIFVKASRSRKSFRNTKKREQSTKEMVQDCRKSYLPPAKLLCNQESLHFHTSSLSHLQTCTSYLLDAASRYHQNHVQKIKRKEAPNNRGMLMMMMMTMPCAVAHTHLTSIHC